MLTLGNVWQGLVGNVRDCPSEVIDEPISDVVIDSRAVKAGALFVALPGEKSDGHLYLEDAFSRGALAAIAEARRLAPGSGDVGGSNAARGVKTDWSLRIPDCYLVDTASGAISQIPRTGAFSGIAGQAPTSSSQSPRFVFVTVDSLRGLQKLAGDWRARMPASAIGITGSVGKTTTKEIVANVLAQRFITLRSEGNLNNEIGLPLTLLRLTPEHERVVLEMGMYALGEIARLCELARPRIGIVTNVGPTHLERLGSIESIAEAKAELVQALPPADEGGTAILNADDHRVRAMALVTRARVFTYGLNPDSDIWADEISSEGLEGIHFRLHYNRDAFYLHLPMLGRHSVHTALRSAAVGLVEGMSWTEIIAGLQEVRGQLRLMVVPGLRETTLIDDTYNASPESMLAALNLLEDLARQAGPAQHLPSGASRSAEGAGPRRLVAVLGDMFELGSYEEEGHRLAGGRAAQVLRAAAASPGAPHGKLITVGQRARWIADEALAEGLPPADVHVVGSNAEAVAVLQGLIRSGDIVLVKGSRAAAMESIVDALSRPQLVRS